MDPIDNIPALVQIMAWCQPGYKRLSEPMLYWRTYASLILNELINMFSTSNASPEYKRVLIVVFIVPADGQAPNSAGPSVLTDRLGMFSSKFL